MRYLSIPILVLGAFGVGCSIGATTEVPRPMAGAPAAPNSVAIATVGAELLGFPPGELVSRASLVRMDSAATCFDIVVRAPREAAREAGPAWHVTLDVDGHESARFELPLHRCDNAACLPAGSALEPFALPESRNVAVLGDRFCVEHAPVARHELALVEHESVGTATFRFHFVDGLATASR